MTAVPAHQAGAGSAVNDTIREVGGALGVAVVGSLSAAAYRSRLGDLLAGRHIPGAVTHVATGSVAAADAVGRQLGGRPGGQIVSAAHDAFVSSMSLGIRVAAAVALVSVVAAVFALPRRPADPPAAGPAAAPEAVLTA